MLRNTAKLILMFIKTYKYCIETKVNQDILLSTSLSRKKQLF